MRFATFNIASGRSADTGRTDLDALAESVRRLDADVLSLQEVDRGQSRSDGADLTAVAARAMVTEHHVFAPALYGTPGEKWTVADDPQHGPAYGCALIGRRPLLDVEVIRIPTAPLAFPLWVPGPGLVVVREEPRVAIVARTELDGGGHVTVVATHLPFVPGWKQYQLRRLVQALRDRPDPLLLLGDLNLRHRSATRISGYRALAQLPTFPASGPRLQLDHVLLRGRLPGGGRVTATSTPVVPSSDHRPLVVDLG